ncbi:MAG: small, acid-soluble spore protein, alpha/beta type [Oscillospiraceae bacterium]
MTNRSNSINIPEAREAMDKFKMEAASDLRVPAPS